MTDMIHNLDSALRLTKRIPKRTIAVSLILTGTQREVEQSIADLKSNIQYDNLGVTVKEVSRD